MLIATDSFIVLKSNNLVKTIDPACYNFWDISVTPGNEESLMKNLPRKTFTSLLVSVVCVQNLAETA